MSARTRVIAQAIVDVVLVLLFAAIGRASHDHGVSPSGVLQTAWPFLIGALVGWCAARAWKAPHRVVPTGIIVWACTLVVGMILRVATGGGFAVSFLIVAGLFLALVLLGSRALVGLAARRSPAS